MKLNAERFRAFLKKQAERLRTEWACTQHQWLESSDQGEPTDYYNLTLDAIEQRIMPHILTPGLLEDPHPHYKDKVRFWFCSEDLYFLAIIYENFSTLAEKYSLEPFEFLHKLLEFEHRVTDMCAMYQGILSESYSRDAKHRRAGKSDRGARGNDGILQAIRDHLDEGIVEYQKQWAHFKLSHAGEMDEYTCSIKRQDQAPEIPPGIIVKLYGSRGRPWASEVLRDYEYTIYWEPDERDPGGHLVQTCIFSSKRKTIHWRHFRNLFYEVKKESV